jgi:hypothetical protein
MEKQSEPCLQSLNSLKIVTNNKTKAAGWNLKAFVDGQLKSREDCYNGAPPCHHPQQVCFSFQL